MRRILETVSLAALALIVWTTGRALAGPHRVPSRIPTHFDFAGHPNGWGTPAMLLLLPIMAGALYGLVTWASRYPEAFNFPVRVTPANRLRLEALALNMTAWLKAEVICLFTWMQITAIQAARSGRVTLSPVLMPISLGIIFGTIIAHVVAMRRAAPPRRPNR